ERLRHLGEPVDSARDVDEGRRPPPALAAADAPVLHVPGRPAVPGKVRAQGPHVAARPPCAPETAVEDDRHGVRTGPVWDVQLAHLLAMRPVPNSDGRPAQIRERPKRGCGHAYP